MIGLLGETVKVLRAKLVDDPMSPDPTVMVETWVDPTSFDITGVLVEPAGSSEPNLDNRDAVVTGYRLYLPGPTDMTAKDRVVVRGVTCRVDGDSQDWRLGGWRPGQVVTVSRVEG